MLAAPSPTSVVASCHAAACGVALTTLKSFKVIKDLKVPNDFLSQITENGKRRTGSALYANTGRGKPTEQYNTKPASARTCGRHPDGTQAGCRNIKLWISAPLICRPVTNFHVRICGKCTPLFSGLQYKDSTKRRDCKFSVGEFFEAADKCQPRDLNDPNDFKVVKVLNVKQPPDIGGCGKV